MALVEERSSSEGKYGKVGKIGQGPRDGTITTSQEVTFQRDDNESLPSTGAAGRSGDDGDEGNVGDRAERKHKTKKKTDGSAQEGSCPMARRNAGMWVATAKGREPLFVAQQRDECGGVWINTANKRVFQVFNFLLFGVFSLFVLPFVPWLSFSTSGA